MSLNPSKLLLATALISTAPAWAALTVNADGTVTDTSTSLVWDRCTYGLSGASCASGTALLADWPTALTTATAANTALYKGFSDWRLPNVKELESIVKIDTSSPAIDSTAFPATPITGGTYGWGGVWSSTSYAPVPAGAWIVNFGNGNSDALNASFTDYVRLVRSGQSLAAFDLLGAPSANVVPTAGAPVISGTAQFGQVLTGAYVYADADSDAQDVSGAGSAYRFVRSTDASVASTGDNTDVASGSTGGANKTYTAQAADVGKYLFYCVTPKALTGLSPGVEACSSATAAIAALPQAITGFAPATPVVLGAAPVPLTASGGASGNPVLFATTSAASICTVLGTQLTYVGAGVCNLIANQAAGNGYSAAPQVAASVTINAAPPPVGAVTAIPTLSEWAMLLLSGLVGLFGLGRVRRRTRVLR